MAQIEEQPAPIYRGSDEIPHKAGAQGKNEI